MNQDKMWESYQNDEALLGVWCQTGGRREFLLKRLPNAANILNIGVGSGLLEELLVQRGADVSCLDPSRTTIERVREKLGLGEKAKVGYSQSMPFADNSFDLVIMSEVLEHLDEEIFENTLIEVKRVLRVGGRFIGTVPADENLDAGITVCPTCAERFHRWGHQQSFSEPRLASVLKRQFKQVRVERVFLGDLKRLNWKGKTSWVLKSVQAAFGIKGENQNFYFEATRG